MEKQQFPGFPNIAVSSIIFRKNLSNKLSQKTVRVYPFKHVIPARERQILASQRRQLQWRVAETVQVASHDHWCHLWLATGLLVFLLFHRCFRINCWISDVSLFFLCLNVQYWQFHNTEASFFCRKIVLERRWFFKVKVRFGGILSCNNFKFKF